MLLHVPLQGKSAFGTSHGVAMKPSKRRGRLQRGIPRSRSRTAAHGWTHHPHSNKQLHSPADAGGDQTVSPPHSLDQHAGDDGCLPPGVEQLLLEAVDDGFVVYCCGPKGAPFALVASYQWENYVDLATIRCFDRITTARIPAPRRSRIDVFAPETVVWAYEGPPQCALRALLDLVHPQHFDAPASVYPAPFSLHIPRTQQRPMTIQLPSPVRAGARATRLAATIAAGVGVFP